MPPHVDSEYPSLRRSRRLSKQEAKKYYEEPEEAFQALPASKISSPSLLARQSDTLDSSFEPAGVSHSRRRPKGNPPRPPNAFMLFRSDFWAREKQKEVPIERDHRDISRIAGYCWNNLADEERARYRKLAAERKEMHNVEHPGYRYIPSNRRGRPKRKLRKGAEEEEERCRKLASFVMKGLSHADLREAMRDIEKKPAVEGATRSPSHGPSRSHRHRSSTSAHRPVTRAQKAIKVEKDGSSPPPDGSATGSADALANIPTDEPSSAESTLIKKEEPDQALESYLRPPSYDVVDHQFSFKHPESPRPSSDPCLWYDSQEVSGFSADALLPLAFSGESSDVAVDFIDPFAEFGSQLSPLTPTLEQRQGIYPYPGSSTFAMSADPSSFCNVHDSDMSKYFHFDF